MSQPLVSILINNYNYEQFLGDAINSALAQTYKKIEIIVVDDGSTDASRQIIADYGDRILSVLKLNGGQASAFNAGFAASSGEIICFLDSDDLFVREKVQRVVEIFEGDAQSGWCFDRLRLFDHGTQDPYFAPGTPIPSHHTYGRWDVRAVIEQTGVAPYIPAATSALSFRREMLERILPMPEAIPITSDNYIKFVALAFSAGVMCSEELSLQRIHGSNAYTKKGTDKRKLVGQIRMLTGFYLFDKSTILRNLAKRSFASGLGMCWITGGFDTKYQQLTKSFFHKLPHWEKLEVLMRAAKEAVRGMARRT